MTRGAALRNLLLVLLLMAVAVGYVLYTNRTASVTCQRSGTRVDCTDTERALGRVIWQSSVSDASLTRRPADNEGNVGAIYLETGNGSQTQFTSGMLGTNEERIDGELHQFLVVRKADPALTMDLAPASTWRDRAVPAGVLAFLFIAALYSLFRLFVPSPPRSKPSGGNAT
jgi:hypothetical protein